MIDKLALTEKRFEEINERLMDPAVINDNMMYRDLMKEYKNLTPLIEKYREYKACKEGFEEAKMMLDEGGMDKEFKEMVQDEFETNKEKMVEIEEEIKILLLPRDPNDDKGVIVEIRGGAGGEEAALFAHSLYRMYSMYAERKGLKVEIGRAHV